MSDKITKKRSVFNLSHSLKTTSRFGSIMPITQAEFVTPDTTLKSNLDFYCEIKPTTSKLNSTITSNVKSFFVPLKRVWEFADNFIASSNHFSQNASLNEPWMHSMMDKNILHMPSISLGELPFMLLASCTANTCDIRTPRAAVAQIARYTWNYQGTDGKIKQTVAGTNWCPWWLPRLIGAGFTQNPTLNVIPQMSGNQQIGLHFITSDSYVVEYMKILQPQYDSDLVDIYVYSTTNDDDEPEVRVKIRNVGEMYEPLDPEHNFDILIVNCGAEKYGSATFNDDEYITDDIAYGALNAIIWGLFGKSTLLGFGSLTESLGFPLFELRKITPYRDARRRYDLLFPFVNCINFDFKNHKLTAKDSFNVSPFSFYAYQAIVTDRYLLPKSVLSPVTPLSGNPRLEPNYAQIDNHYCHNYVVPTKCYENQALTNLWDGCVLNGGIYAREYCGITSAIDIAQRLQASITFNQMCSIFLDRSPLIDSDIYAKFWQVPDSNVTSILSNVSTAIVDVNRKVDAKQMAITKKLSEFLRLGGWTCSTDEFIENHFGVKDSIDSSCEVVTIATDSRYIAITDVTNQGGAVDEDGNTMPLGQKASVASDTASHINNFEFYSKSYGWFLTLHHLSVANEYLNVPDVTSSRLSNISTEDFTLMTAPEFQDTGDEPIYCDDIEAGIVENNPAVAWKEKNWFLKDKANRVCGEYVDKYRDQLIIPTDSLWNEHFAELSYVYLQKTPFDFSRYFVDATGDNILINVAFHMYKKAPMTRSNNVLV